MLAAARVTLKQCRFEVAVAALAALAVGLWGLVVEYRLDALNVPFRCIDNFLARVDGPEGAGDCAGPMQAWSAILAVEGARIFEVMKVLPFAAGLLGGVPIVARELEAGTAQTAWSLDGSRMRWLVRQATPVMIILAVALTFAALVAAMVEADRVAWGEPAVLT